MFSCLVASYSVELRHNFSAKTSSLSWAGGGLGNGALSVLFIQSHFMDEDGPIIEGVSYDT